MECPSCGSQMFYKSTQTTGGTHVEKWCSKCGHVEHKAIPVQYSGTYTTA